MVTPTEESGSRELKLADFNQDGNIDVFFSLTSVAGGFILFGKSDGTLHSPVYLTPFHEREISFGAAIADVNKDGLLDWVYSRFSDFAIRLGTPEGKFLIVDSIPHPAPLDIEVADLNLDGHYDCIYETADSLSYSLHNGTTPFNVMKGFHQSPRLPRFALADLNHDRFVDVVSYDSDSIFVFMNLGNTLNSPAPEERPRGFTLNQNYPNPFNPFTTIEYRLSRPSAVMLEVFDALGRKVSELVNEVKPEGRHLTSFNGQGFSSGVYFYRLRAQGFQEMKKMTLIK